MHFFIKIQIFEFSLLHTDSYNLFTISINNQHTFHCNVFRFLFYVDLWCFEVAAFRGVLSQRCGSTNQISS